MGKRTSITNTDEADLNGDGKVTAHDAELYLKRMTEAVVTLPANGDVTVSVGITLTEDAKSLLKQAFPNGAYVEGYVTPLPRLRTRGFRHPLTPFLCWASTAAGTTPICLTGQLTPQRSLVRRSTPPMSPWIRL